MTEAEEAHIDVARATSIEAEEAHIDVARATSIEAEEAHIDVARATSIEAEEAHEILRLIEETQKFIIYAGQLYRCVAFCDEDGKNKKLRRKPKFKAVPLEARPSLVDPVVVVFGDNEWIAEI